MWLGRPNNIWCNKKNSKRSNDTLLCLLSFLLHQTLLMVRDVGKQGFCFCLFVDRRKHKLWDKLYTCFSFWHIKLIRGQIFEWSRLFSRLRKSIIVNNFIFILVTVWNIMEINKLLTGSDNEFRISHLQIQTVTNFHEFLIQ